MLFSGSKVQQGGKLQVIINPNILIMKGKSPGYAGKEQLKHVAKKRKPRCRNIGASVKVLISVLLKQLNKPF